MIRTFTAILALAITITTLAPVAEAGQRGLGAKAHSLKSAEALRGARGKTWQQIRIGRMSKQWLRRKPAQAPYAEFINQMQRSYQPLWDR